MSIRDDAGSTFHGGGGYSGYGGASANGGLGGGQGGGMMGGGYGGYGGGPNAGGSLNGNGRTGLTTGNRMIGGMAVGIPGGLARNPGAWGIRPQAPVQQSALNRPTHPALGPRVPGLLDNPPAVPTIEDVPMPPMQTPAPAYYNPLSSIAMPPASIPQKSIYDRAPYEPGFIGNNFDPATGMVGAGNYVNPYGKENFQGPQPTVLGGKTDYQGSNYNGYKGYY